MSGLDIEIVVAIARRTDEREAEIKRLREEIERLLNALRDIRAEANHLNATVREERIWHMASDALAERNQDGND